jgi:hypothetical protein
MKTVAMAVGAGDRDSYYQGRCAQHARDALHTHRRGCDASVRQIEVKTRGARIGRWGAVRWEKEKKKGWERRKIGMGS